MRPVPLRIPLFALVLLVLLVGCGAPLADAVQRDLERGGSVEDALARIERGEAAERDEARRRVALAAIEAAARADEPRSRDRAFAAFAQLGAVAEPRLERLSNGEDADLASRARVALAARGKRSARRALAPELESTDDVRLARALSVLGDEVATERLVSLLESTSPDVRRAAASALVGRPLASAAERLFEIARRDPAAVVRASACRAVVRDAASAERVLVFLADERDAGAYGPCVGAVAARLAPSVVVAELATLPTSLDERSLALVRVALGLRSDEVRDALLAQLPAWLASERPSIRAALVNALPESLVPSPSLGLVGRLEAERVVVVRIALAARLVRVPTTREAAVATLMELAPLETVDGVEAAELLRTAGRAEGTTRLRERLSATDPTIRAAAARALVGDPDTAQLAALLVDADEGVRLAAAVSILR